MFCPKCKAEYREGFRECSDCQIPLVRELPPEPQQALEPVELVTVFASEYPGLIAVAKSILQDAGIKYATKDENVKYILLIDPIQIQVRQEDTKKSRKLLQGLEEKKQDVSADTDGNEIDKTSKKIHTEEIGSYNLWNMIHATMTLGA